MEHRSTRPIRNVPALRTFAPWIRPGVLSAVAVTVATFACSGNDSNGSGVYGTGGSTGSSGGSTNYGGNVVSASCGDGVVDPGEDCDGMNLGAATCASASANARPQGTLVCQGCTFDLSACTSSGAGGALGSGGGLGAGGMFGNGGTVSTGGAVSTGGTVGAGGATSGGTTPSSLPTATQTCPTLTSGMVSFLGLPVNLWVGPKGAVAGPVVFYFHGTGQHYGEAVTAFGQAAINEVTANGGVIASFETSTAQGANTGNNVWYTGDFLVADEILACAIQQLNIDTRHIHAAGYSAGGLQTGTMSYNRSNYLASILIYSGGAIVTTPDADPGNVPAVLCSHGAPGSDVFILDFAAGCTNFETGVKQRGGFAIDCNDGSSHIDIIKRMAVAPNAWQFFKDHPFGVTPEPYVTLPSSFPSYCTIY